MMLHQTSNRSDTQTSIDRELWCYPTPRVRSPHYHTRFQARTRPHTPLRFWQDHWQCLLLIAGGVLCMIAPIVECFNLEQRQPLIKYGHQNSYFGYSLATHTIGEYNWPNNTKWHTLVPQTRGNYSNNNFTDSSI